ncbi:unnamed protein product [Ceratitis capitata]|uniref:(Mediterranean fruit fly) hypothetical protein n=3 Tax=Ceratitis capitata TaxID=7213 RepID=A0A811TZV8_CERCA|nr:unnamed protein product [Ceratitis capitata]
MQWYKLTADPNDLQAALLETQQLRVTSMSTALLTVFIDSAKNLKQARTSSKPDPYLIAMVGKHKEQTAMIMRDDSPVWEQGFTFLVSNPENESLQIRIMDQKTNNEIGQYTYPLNLLLPKKNMELVSQPFQLQKSGPESKLIMSLSLRILKPAEVLEETEQTASSPESSIALTRSSSLKTPTQESASNKDLQLQTSRISIESPIAEEQIITMNSSPAATPYSAALETGEAVLTHRMPDLTSSTGEYGLGRIQLSIRYSVQRQKLTVTVHKIMYLPLRDPSSIPDPYVKLYLLPARNKESKRKTMVIKDNCNPVYEATFEYLISTAELAQTELEVTVCSQKGFLYGGSPIMGMLKIPLNEPEISSNGINSWMDLQPEMKHD